MSDQGRQTVAFLNQISQVLIKFSLQSLRSLAATRRPEQATLHRSWARLFKSSGLLCPGSAVGWGQGCAWQRCGRGRLHKVTPADMQSPFNDTQFKRLGLGFPSLGSSCSFAARGIATAGQEFSKISLCRINVEQRGTSLDSKEKGVLCF